jgi:hypothetical protein
MGLSCRTGGGMSAVSSGTRVGRVGAVVLGAGAMIASPWVASADSGESDSAVVTGPAARSECS